MARLKVKQMNLTGSLIPVGIPTDGVFSVSYLTESMSIPDAIDKLATETTNSNKIGNPDDGGYVDGFFNSWTNLTKISNAFDDINELLTVLVPDQAGNLDSQDLLKTFPNTFTGRISDGLDENHWGSNISGSLSTQLTIGTDFNLYTSNSATRFHAGRSGSFKGGITGSVRLGDGSIYPISRSYSEGIGSNSSGSCCSIQLTAFDTYNDIWLKANASITGSFVGTGSYEYQIGGTDGGVTNWYQLYYVGSYPSPSFSIDPSGSVIESPKWLSGISYYGNGTIIDINYQVVNLANPVYYQDRSAVTTVESDYFSHVNVGFDKIPDKADPLDALPSRTLSSNKNTLYNDIGSWTVKLRKAGKSDVTFNQDLGVKAINTHGTASTTTAEYFLDEDKRYYGVNSSSWDSSISLNDGQLQVQNGRLINGEFGDYGAFSNVDQYFYRVFTSANINYNGSITILRIGFGGIANIVGEWSGSEKLQMGFYLQSETGSVIYDLGRPVGDDIGNIKGIRNGSISGNTINWSLPMGVQTDNTDPLILITNFSESISNDFITQINISFDLG